MIKLNSGEFEALISELGGELKSFSYKGINILHEPDAVWNRTAPILFPIVGRLKDGKTLIKDKVYSLPTHGFLRNYNLAVKEQTKTKVTLTFSDTKDTYLLFPYHFIVTVIYQLTLTGLEVTFKVKSMNSEPFFFSLGFHPGFRVKSIFDTKVTFKELENLITPRVSDKGLLDFQVQKEILKGTELRLDDNYFLEDAIIFSDLNSKSLIFDTGFPERLKISYEGFNTLAFWSRPGANFLCIEAWRGFPDEVEDRGIYLEKRDLVKLISGEEKEFKYQIQMEEFL